MGTTILETESTPKASVPVLWASVTVAFFGCKFTKQIYWWPGGASGHDGCKGYALPLVGPDVALSGLHPAACRGSCVQK